MTKSLVLDDGCVTHPLVFSEDAVGKRVPKAVDLDQLVHALASKLRLVERSLLLAREL